VIKEAQTAVVDCRFKIGNHEATPMVCVLPQSVTVALLSARAAGSGSPEITLGAPQAAGAGGALHVQPVQFGTVSGSAPQDAGTMGNLELLLDVPLEVTVELGRASRRVRDVLSLGPGSVVELSKLAGEPVDLLVNGKPIARAEVVVIDENFAVRIIEILAREERLAAGGL
jgi:flagellar motor switch protein FliN/FliY